MNVSKIGVVVFFLLCSVAGTSQTKEVTCTDDCCSKDSSVKKTLIKSVKMDTQVKTKEVSCKLTSLELRKRKEQVMASLKKKVLSRQELANGYMYKFEGSDNTLDELLSFIKTERLCCDFFDFKLDVAGDGTEAWLTIVGPEGAKIFIDTEMEL
ncbi:hypothetical protein [Paraflavitalea sp. CAU 1676]|uniref:hypothetical protein n=1 Tax=Paraflavitalea sp. CAU 1676 TaxID=3032598 RepID=UPI0023DA9F45|nr:hypothetical protein [Paraflavitalea sp. CAU 1676]MDF2191312.1 hypothetical protein [Paraflavitalea sp. CAU 1676]